MPINMGLEKICQAEWRRYQLCGIVLALMNIALAGVVILVIHQDKGLNTRDP